MTEISFLGVGVSKDFTESDFADLEAFDIICAGVGHLVGFAHKKRRTLGVFKNAEPIGQRILKTQEKLEKIIEKGRLLPASFTATFQSMDEMRTFIICNEERLSQSLEDYGGKVQYQLQFSWQQNKMVDLLKNDPSIAHLRANDISLSPKQIADALASAVTEITKRTATEIVANLSSVCPDHLSLPVEDVSAVANIVCLINRPGDDDNSVAELELVLEKIDQQYDDGLKIKMIGPLPPVSFASISKEEITGDAITEALDCLSIGADFGLHDVKNAYREYMKSAHPDVGGTEEMADQGTQAYNLLQKILTHTDMDDIQSRRSIAICRIDRAEAA